MIYDLTLQSVPVRMSVHDSGASSEEILGDAFYTFEGEEATLLAPMRLIQYNGLGEALESTLAEAHEEHTGQPWEQGGELCVTVDAGIAGVALLLARGAPFCFEVDTSGEYWAFHDTAHATEDVSADWEEGYADFPGPTAGAEDRANFLGARRALAAGLSVEKVLGELVSLRAPFRERFDGEESTALADLLSEGFDNIPEDKRPNVATVLTHIETCARDILESNPDATEDDLSELAREYVDGDGMAEHRPGLVLAALADYADAALGLEDNPSLEIRAWYALESAVTVRVHELANEKEES